MVGGAGATFFISLKIPTTFIFASISSSTTVRAAHSAAAALSSNRPAPLLCSSSTFALLTPSQNSGAGRDSRRTSLSQWRQRQQIAMASSDAAPSTPQVRRSDEEWRTVLSPEQFRILRQKGTEWAGTGKYDKFSEQGLYECAGCGTPLYKSTTKFNSGCGWPAFYEGLPGAITETADADGRRIEITCTACGGHLGHTFKGEGFPTPTDERHCVNSISLKFTPANK